MTLFDDIARFFGDNFGRPGSENPTFFGSIFESFWTIIFFIVIAIIIFVAWRTVRHITAYAGTGEGLESWKFTIQGMSMVKGNLSKNTTAVDDGNLETILMASEYYKNDIIKNGIKHYQEEYKNGNLFIYDFRPRDWEDAWDLNAKDSIIITAVDLEDKNYSWLDPKGDWNVLSPSFRLKSRNVVCFAESEYMEDLEDPYGDEFDAYNLIPMPRTLTNKMQVVGGKTTATLELKKVMFGKAVAILSQYVPTLSETYERIIPSETEVNRLRDVVKEKDIEISDVHREAEDDRHIAVPHPLIGHARPMSFIGKGEIAVWVVVALICGAFGYAMPDLITSLKQQVSGWMTFFGAFIIFMVVFSYFQSKKKQSMVKAQREEAQI